MDIAAQHDQVSSGAEEDFELDVSFAARGTTIGALMSSTSDGCGSTRASACVGCISD